MIKIEPLALRRAVADKEYKSVSADLEPGKYAVDCTVRLLGAIKKGSPFETTVPAAANPWKIAALALSKLNGATIESIVRDSLAVNDDLASAVKQQAQEAIDRIVASTKRLSSGRVTGTVTWELE